MQEAFAISTIISRPSFYMKKYIKNGKYYTEDYSFYITLITKKLNLKLSLIVYNNFTLIHTKKRRMAEMLL